jgi:hypothetical protein
LEVPQLLALLDELLQHLLCLTTNQPLLLLSHDLVSLVVLLDGLSSSLPRHHLLWNPPHHLHPAVLLLWNEPRSRSFDQPTTD